LPLDSVYVENSIPASDGVHGFSIVVGALSVIGVPRTILNPGQVLHRLRQQFAGRIHLDHLNEKSALPDVAVSRHICAHR
jgi:uncharacterized protein YjiS (DUF1127 family)